MYVCMYEKYVLRTCVCIYVLRPMYIPTYLCAFVYMYEFMYVYRHMYVLLLVYSVRFYQCGSGWF